VKWAIVGFVIAIALLLVVIIFVALVFSALVVKTGRFLDHCGISVSSDHPDRRRDSQRSLIAKWHRHTP